MQLSKNKNKKKSLNVILRIYVEICQKGTKDEGYSIL